MGLKENQYDLQWDREVKSLNPQTAQLRERLTSHFDSEIQVRDVG